MFGKSALQVCCSSNLSANLLLFEYSVSCHCSVNYSVYKYRLKFKRKIHQWAAEYAQLLKTPWNQQIWIIRNSNDIFGSTFIRCNDTINFHGYVSLSLHEGRCISNGKIYWERCWIDKIRISASISLIDTIRYTGLIKSMAFQILCTICWLWRP